MAFFWFLLMFWNKWVEGELKFGNVEEVKDDIMTLFRKHDEALTGGSGLDVQSS
jgi:hypothetical protein